MSNQMTVKEFNQKISSNDQGNSWISQLRQLMERDSVVQLKGDNPEPLSLQWRGWS